MRQIDWIKAAVLYVKAEQKLEWADMAAKIKVQPDKLRKMVTGKHSDEWDREIKRALCKALGISVKMVIKAEGVELR